VEKMVSEINKVILNHENYQLGEAIVKLMKNKHKIGIFSIKENRLMEWVRSMFEGAKFNNCQLIDSYDDNNMNNYDGIIMIDVKFNCKSNHIKFYKSSSSKFGAKRFTPAIYVVFEVDLSSNNEQIFDCERFRNGINYWKIQNEFSLH
jgi:NhaP-type Na+/H+ and K+/H+ antiporter